jgi:hypothetical protein
VVNVAVVMCDNASMVDASSGGSAGVVISKPSFLSKCPHHAVKAPTATKWPMGGR